MRKYPFLAAAVALGLVASGLPAQAQMMGGNGGDYRYGRLRPRYDGAWLRLRHDGWPGGGRGPSWMMHGYGYGPGWACRAATAPGPA